MSGLIWAAAGGGNARADETGTTGEQGDPKKWKTSYRWVLAGPRSTAYTSSDIITVETSGTTGAEWQALKGNESLNNPLPVGVTVTTPRHAVAWWPDEGTRQVVVVKSIDPNPPVAENVLNPDGTYSVVSVFDCYEEDVVSNPPE